MPYFEIPWQWLMNDEDKQSLVEEEVTAVDVHPIRLRFEEDKGMIAKWERITPKLSEWLSDQSFYLDGALNRDAFNQALQEVIEEDNSELLANKLFATLKKIYGSPNREVHSLTFTSYERHEPQDDTGRESIHLSLNTIEDTLSIQAIPIEVRYNNDGSLQDVIVRSEEDRSNTPRGLSLDAYFDENTEPVVTALMATIQKTMIKQTYAGNEKQVVKLVKQAVESDLEDLKDEEATFSSIESWVHHAEGKYNAHLIGVEYLDEGARPLTHYTVAVPNAEKIQRFTVTIDRSTNKITQINKEDK